MTLRLSDELRRAPWWVKLALLMVTTGMTYLVASLLVNLTDLYHRVRVMPDARIQSLDLNHYLISVMTVVPLCLWVQIGWMFVVAAVTHRHHKSVRRFMSRDRFVGYRRRATTRGVL